MKGAVQDVRANVTWLKTMPDVKGSWGSEFKRVSCPVSHTDQLQGLFESVVGSLIYRGLLSL